MTPKPKQTLIIRLNKDICFKNTSLPQDLDQKTRMYLEAFIQYSNDCIQDIREFLLENAACEKCFCITCAFTIIGLIPFGCWICKRKREKKEMHMKILDTLDQCARDAMKNMNKDECIIRFIGKEGDESELNCYYEIELMKTITALPMRKKKLVIMENIISIRDEALTQRNAVVNSQPNQDQKDYKAGCYDINNQLQFQNQPQLYPQTQPQSQNEGGINYYQEQYVNIYQGNHLINNQLSSNVQLKPNLDVMYHGEGNYQISPYNQI